MQINTEKSIFFQALEIDAPDQRAEFVATACQGDQELLKAVRGLLWENDREQNPVDKPVMDALNPTLARDDQGRITDSRFIPGTMVGPYKLMEQIGEGGFGLVFVADQQQPVCRRVALKIIKPGMNSRDVLARFEAERQALAMMDHPHIARVFDAGATETGQPYFVMELVRGVQLIEFCDNHRLDARSRLDLFLSICHAVQHAHQKGIIHRDLKPSNVLVTLQDGRPIPKVIDFGLVKAISQSLTEKTIYTRFTAMMGTPAYMSPEQAEMSNVDVDTRTDIYSLGVILYELLVGSTPFTKERLNEADFDELRHMILEEEPQRPSARMGTLGNELATTVSTSRQTRPNELTSLMKGDLDWIVMKALDKDRNRRYPSAVAMAEDIQRFLHAQPVEARPPTTMYRFTKFARRNKVALTTISLVATALIVGTVVSVWQAGVAYDALEQARQAEAAANESREELATFNDRLTEANALLSSGRAYVEAGNLAAAQSAFTQATEVQPRYYHVWMERGALYARLGLWERAAADYAKAIELGAPADRAEFMGVPQLLHYLDNPMYQKLRQNLLEADFSSSTNVRGLLVGNLSTELARQLADEAEKSLDIGRGMHLPPFWMGHRERSGGNPPHPRQGPGERTPLGAELYIAGWANLKAGELDLAITRLNQSRTNDPRWSGRGISDPLLAIAYHHKGLAKESKTALNRSTSRFNRWLDQSLESNHTDLPMPWFDWIEFLIHYRAAIALDGGELSTIDAHLKELEMRAVEAIQ